MKVDFATDTGAVRSSNQDACSCGLFPGGGAWAVVCDGMGGANGGNIASAIAVERIEGLLKSGYRENMSPGNIKSMIINAVLRANTAIYQRAAEEAGLQGMGTTAVVMLAVKNRLYVAHVGDSRAYLKSRDGIRQLTMDHSYVQNLVNFGQITKEEARTHPRRNIITRVLGVHDDVNVDYAAWDFAAGDMALACTYGLTNYADEDLLEEYTDRHSGDSGALIHELIRFAIDSGGSDNITIAVVDNI